MEFLVIATLFAVCIGAATAIFTFIYYAAIRPFPYRDPDKLVGVTSKRPADPNVLQTIPWPYFRELRSHELGKRGVFENVAAFRSYESILRSDEAIEPLQVADISPGLLAILGIKPIMGRDFEESDDVAGSEPVALVSFDFWRHRLSSDPNVVGKSIRIGSRGTSYEVVGVLPDDFKFFKYTSRSSPAVLKTFESSFPGGGPVTNVPVSVIGRIGAATLPQARAVLRQAVARADTAIQGIRVERKVELEGFTSYVLGDLRFRLSWLAAAAGLLILTGCSNVSTVILAKVASARNQLAVRRALGARSVDLMLPLAIQVSIPALIGAAAGIFLAGVLVKVTTASFGDALSLTRLNEASVGLRIAVYAAAFTLIAAAICSAPSFLAIARWARSTGNLGSELRGISNLPAFGSSWRTWIAGMQIGLSMLLLLGAAWIGLGIRAAQRRTLGHEYRNVAVMRVKILPISGLHQSEWQDFFHKLIAYAGRLPGVTSAAATSLLPFDGDFSAVLAIDTHPVDPATAYTQLVELRRVTPEYFGTIALQQTSGTPFDWRDCRNNFAIVNESFARLSWPGVDPIAHRFSSPHEEYKVIGTVENTPASPFSRGNEPMVFVCGSSAWMYLIVRTSNDARSLSISLQDYARTMTKEVTFDDSFTLDRQVESALIKPRLEETLLAGFCIAAIVIAACAIYGAVAHSAGRRSREVAIRIAMGAGWCDVMRATLWADLRLSIFSIITAAGTFRMLQPRLSSAFYGFGGLAPAVLAIVCGSMLAISTVAAWLAARGATKIDPASALRFE